MSKFERGISDKVFIATLTKEFATPTSLWHNIAHDKELFIAIRNKSLNVYHKGNSVCKLEYKSGNIVGETHYKFLLDPDLEEYVKSKNGIFTYSNLGGRFIQSLADIGKIKKASNVYAGIEKSGVHTKVRKTANVVDVEIAFSDIIKKKDRIDYAVLEERKGSIFLVFWEAKHFSNPEIRAKGVPKVLAQLSNYETAIAIHKTEIINSYRIVCENLRDLGLIHGRNLVLNVANGAPLDVDPKPRLFIFGYDSDQEIGKVWNIHKKTLKTALGDRLKTIGNV